MPLQHSTVLFIDLLVLLFCLLLLHFPRRLWRHFACALLLLKAGAEEIPAGDPRYSLALPASRTAPANSPGRLHPMLALPSPEPKTEKLPWPHQPPGLSPAQIDRLNREIWVINNNPLFQADERGDWCYLHGGLDIVLTNGASIYAVKDGWVKAMEHSAVTVADCKDNRPCYGWSYAHLGDIQVREGDFVPKGTLLGKVEFLGLPHTHLDKVFSQGEYWHSWRYICFPDDYFTFVDDEPPTIEAPFYFFEHNTDKLVLPQPDGTVAVRGDIDIVVAMRDGGQFAHSQESGFGDRLGVTKIEYTIAPAGKPLARRHFASFDFRKARFLSGTDVSARRYTTSLAKTVYKHWSLFGYTPSGDRNVSYYIISHCPEEAPPAELDSTLTNYCWHTAASDSKGLSYPDGEYIITVSAFDSHGNSATNSMRITVDNTGTLTISCREPPKLEAQAASSATPFRSGSASRPVRSEMSLPASVSGWFRRLGHDSDSGLSPFTALNALIALAKENKVNRDEIVLEATRIVEDEHQELARRWQSCYVLSGTGDPRGLPAISHALQDSNETVRAVAACALGQFDHPDALSALKQAETTEKAMRVKEEIERVLKGAYRE